MPATGLTALLEAEERKIADGEAGACGYTCADHGGYTCARAQHPDEPDNRTPHLARLDDGLVQWTGPCTTG